MLITLLFGWLTACGEASQQVSSTIGSPPGATSSGHGSAAGRPPKPTRFHRSAPADRPGGATFEQLLSSDACKLIPVSVVQRFFPGQYGLSPSHGSTPGMHAPTGACTYYPSGAGPITVAYGLSSGNALAQAQRTQLPSSIRIPVGSYGVVNKPDLSTSEVVFFDARHFVAAETVGRRGVSVSTLVAFARAIEQAMPQ
jgi:hypothetical protein